MTPAERPPEAAASVPAIADIDHLDPPPWRLVWAVTLALFTVTGFFRFTYKYFEDVAVGEAGPFARRLIEEATGTYAAAALFVVAVWFVWRYPLDRPGARRRVPAHMAAMAIYSAVHTTVLLV